MGDNYFLFPNSDIQQFHNLASDNASGSLAIAYLELLAAMIAVICFTPLCHDKCVRLNCDNSAAVVWLQRGRCPTGVGFQMLAVTELYKHRHRVKISTRHIKGVANISADSLSRGKIPVWLKSFGKKCELNLNNVANILRDPLPEWIKVLSAQSTF